MTLSYPGPTPVGAHDLVNQAYLQTLLAENLTQDQVDALIASGFAGYASRAYVDSQDALNATAAFIDAGDAVRLHLSAVGTASGPVGLDATGKIGVANLSNITSTQRWPDPFYSPASYNAATVNNATSTETVVYSAAVADPGLSYKLMVTGTVDVGTIVDGEYPVVRVRVGSSTGPIIAGGYGTSEYYTISDTVGTWGSGVNFYTPPSFSTSLDLVGVGGGGSGEGEEFFNMGQGGKAGSWNGVTLAAGTDYTPGTTTFTITPGVGGAGLGFYFQLGNPGTATTFTWTDPSNHARSLNCAGGDGGSGLLALGFSGQGAGNFVFNGTTYIGGGPSAPNTRGKFPGGGSGGAILFSPVTFAGGNGEAWATARVPTGMGSVSYSTATIAPVGYAAQSARSGATTLYVTLVRSGTTSTVSATPLEPSLYIVPIPA